MADGDKPRLAGESAYYLEKQLRDFAAGTRENVLMSALAKTLSDPARATVSRYFASLPRTAGFPAPASSPNQRARGYQLAIEGSEKQSVQACNNCHGPEGSGVPFSAPALAGQLAPYLAAQLRSFQQGTRKNDAGSVMSSVASRLDDADIAAVSSYYAGLNPVPAEAH